ncbi:PREDICTED: trafficking protein particle complex subunit 3 [Nicrophorus vespilloides]|uniref:Trafficking protein particle complex subunit n=1 Tax=Nicrophorus vespilloides TaxID=110193 RepID=A0ABM1ND20_NICVS|nr:PREDICTED: trafficking protein particle complex subunit 3 [Nicrophorus vespilloides]
MSRSSSRIDTKKVNSELVTLTYGALVAQMIKDLDNADDVSKQLERLGYNMGIRIVEDFLSKTGSGRCLDLKDTADKVQMAFKMYLGVQPNVANWSAAGDEFSFILDSNPLTELVELPDDLKNLKYCNIICGVLRGALEMVHLDVQSWIVQDQLKGDSNTEIRLKFIRRLEDSIPAGED